MSQEPNPPGGTSSAPPAVKTVSARDAVAVAKIFVFGLLSRVVPSRHWRGLCDRMAGIMLWLRRARYGERAERVGRIIGNERVVADPRHIVRRRMANGFESHFQLFRLFFRGRFDPDILLNGQPHIDAALARGRGVILWSGQFSFAFLVEHMGLHRAGYGAHRLTRPGHGMSQSRLGVRFLNPIQSKTEGRYLAGQMVLRAGSFAALRAVERRLRDNQIVVVRSHDAARTVLEMPFLDGRIRLAAGPVELARATGAALLPVFTVRNDAGEFEVHVLDPIDVRPADDPEQAVEAAMRAYVCILEEFVRKFPGDWIGWDTPARPRGSEAGGEILRAPGAESLH